MQRAQTLEITQRTNATATRGSELGTWGLKPLPVDPGSSLAADDEEFIPELGGDQVSITARFPIMNAIDRLVSVHELIAWRPTSRNSHATSLGSLCRTATESSATTIWLLSSTDREVRRSATVRFNTSELNAQRSGHTAHRKFLESDPTRMHIAECAVALFEAQAQKRMPRISRERHYPRRLSPTVQQWAALLPRPSHRKGC